MALEDYGSHNAYVWDRNYLNNVVTTGKNPIITDENLKSAFFEVDRADFLPADLKDEAYSDKDLDFGYGEEVNSPVLVAQMLAALQLKPGDKVLDLGTGSGYVLTIIAKTIGAQGRVYGVERNQQIASFARTRLEEYEVSNAELVFKDGSEGLISKAPYDGIHISFAYDDIPEQLVSQLKVGARLVTPITNTEIKLVTRISEDQYEQESITAKQFKKLVSGVE